MTTGSRSFATHGPSTFLFAAGAGIIGGIVGASFQLASIGLQWLTIGEGSLLEAAENLPPYRAVLTPFLGAVAAVAIHYALTRKREAQGMSNVMEAVTLKKAQELRIAPMLARALSSLAVIGTGGSVGREGPIVYLSAALGARFSRLARVPVPRLGLFAGCGVAAGMAAAYDAPLGASLFAMEVVLGNFAVDIFAPVVVASVVASLVVRGLAAGPLAGVLEPGPVYKLPKLMAGQPEEYLLYLLLGGLAACGAWLFVRAIHAGERFFRRLPVNAYLRLPIGGLLVGAIGVWLPHVWGNGYHAVNTVLKGSPALGFVALLFVMKIVATAITLGSGGSGGIFTPTLFVGAALGLLFGTGAHALLPASVAEPNAYAVVGMAAVLAATTHAPIMAIFLMLEMTRETEIVAPLMVATIAASVCARLLGLDSVYVEPLKRRGVRLPEGIEETTLTTTRVGDIMRQEAIWISANTTFDMIVGMVQKARRDSLYVVDANKVLRGAIRIHDIKNYLADHHLGAAVIAADIAVRVPSAFPSQTLAEIIDKFDDPELHELPVVDPADGRIVGVLDRRDLIAALSVEVLKSRGLRAKFVSPEGAADYVEMPRGHAVARVPLPPAMAGQTLGTVNFRQLTGLSVLTIVRDVDGRETRLLPAPSTALRAGDALIVTGTEEAIEEFRARSG
jgi:CIC family chloride channel protein